MGCFVTHWNIEYQKIKTSTTTITNARPHANTQMPVPAWLLFSLSLSFIFLHHHFSRRILLYLRNATRILLAIQVIEIMKHRYQNDRNDGKKTFLSFALCVCVRFLLSVSSRIFLCVWRWTVRMCDQLNIMREKWHCVH